MIVQTLSKTIQVIEQQLKEAPIVYEGIEQELENLKAHMKKIHRYLSPSKIGFRS